MAASTEWNSHFLTGKNQYEHRYAHIYTHSCTNPKDANYTGDNYEHLFIFYKDISQISLKDLVEITKPDWAKRNSKDVQYRLQAINIIGQNNDDKYPKWFVLITTAPTHLYKDYGFITWQERVAIETEIISHNNIDFSFRTESWEDFYSKKEKYRLTLRHKDFDRFTTLVGFVGEDMRLSFYGGVNKDAFGKYMGVINFYTALLMSFEFILKGDESVPKLR